MKPLWIDDAETLQGFCRELADWEVIAVDTESDHFHAYRARTCLIQVGIPGLAALVDPLALTPEELSPLFTRLEDPDQVKILHSARNDVLELHRDYDIVIDNVFDTQIAARFLRYEKESLSWLLSEFAGLKLSKQYQRFDWMRRPIPAPAQEYAAEDVRHLFGLRDKMTAELADAGWSRAHTEHCRRDCDPTGVTYNEFDPEGWRKIKGSKHLDDRGRAALRRLYLFRHEVCSRINSAALHVLPNHCLVAIAEARPTSPRALDDIRGIPASTLRHDAEGILEAVRLAATDRPPAARAPRSRGPHRTEVDKGVVERLSDWRNDAADRLGLPGDLLATRAVLTELAALRPSSLSELHDSRLLLPWQLERFADEILARIGG